MTLAESDCVESVHVHFSLLNAILEATLMLSFYINVALY